MNARRTLIIIIAIAVGAVAAISTVLYVNSVQSRANHNAKLVAVYVIAKDVPKNTTGDTAIAAGLIKKSSIPKQFYPATAVTNVNEIKGRVTPNLLPAGQILVEREFVEPNVANQSFSTTNIPAGQVAISIAVDSTKAVSGLIVPGDKVDLVFFGGTANAKGTEAGSYAHVMYQNVNVIAIGTTAAPKQGDTTAPASVNTAGTFTFALPPDAAERVLLAANAGGLTLALVPPDNQPVTIPAVSATAIDNPGAAAPPPGLTPYGQ